MSAEKMNIDRLYARRGRDKRNAIKEYNLHGTRMGYDELIILRLGKKSGFDLSMLIKHKE